MTDSSLKHHIATEKKNGISAKEMAEMLTHVVFYDGLPKGWARTADALQ